MSGNAAVARVRDLLTQVPRAPDLPAARGAHDAEIADLARRLGQPLPAALVAWLRLCRGDVIGPGGVFGARPDEPVAGDGCGNIYALVARGPLTGMVGFVETVTDPDRIHYLVASDQWRFLRFLLAKEIGEHGWPFGETFVLSIDPHLAGEPVQLLPWRT